MINGIGDEVARELSRFGASPEFAALVEAWPSAVGSDIARNAWPARVARDGTVSVHASSAAWAFELGQLEPRIRASLGALAPPRLRFVVGHLPEPPHVAEEPSRRPPEPSQEQRREAARIASEIDDENLRKVVAKAASLSLSRAESDRKFW